MNQLDIVKSKILTKDNLEPIVSSSNFKGHRIVFTNGCFDLLHRGHVEYLAKAASYGDVMFVGVNTDQSIYRIKKKMPVMDEYSRQLILASLHFIDYVIPFDEDTPFELIQMIQPDVLIKGGDYKANEIVGYDIVKKKGGEVITIELVENYSSTAIIERIRKEK
jgi:rfaE bifunctional protein nucleotidyltransferase chain/domain